MKKITLIVLVLSSTAIFAQSKTEALKNYFAGNDVICPAGKVEFHYKGSTIKRETDGGQTYEQVLKSGGFFQDEVSHGALKEIVLNGKTVKGYGQAGSKQVEPLFKDQEQPRRSFFYARKDSATIKQQADMAKQGYDEISVWIKINWAYVFDMFDYASYFLWCVGILFYLYSRVAAREFQHTGKLQDKLILGIQRTSALVLMCIAILIASIYMVQLFFVASDWNLWMPAKLLFLFGVVSLVVEGICFVVPNTKHGNGGFWQKKGNDYEPPNKQIR